MILFVLPGAVVGQQETGGEIKELKKEIESLKIIQTEVLKELLEIKKLLATRAVANPEPAPREIIIDTEGAPIKGNERCPFRFNRVFGLRVSVLFPICPRYHAID